MKLPIVLGHHIIVEEETKDGQSTPQNERAHEIVECPIGEVLF